MILVAFRIAHSRASDGRPFRPRNNALMAMRWSLVKRHAPHHCRLPDSAKPAMQLRHCFCWRALRESNPCFRRERAASWTARRRARTTRERRCGKRATYKEVWLRAQSKRLRSNVLMEPDLFGEPVSTFPDHARAASNRSRGGFEGPRGWPVTSARYWASTARAPSAAAPRLSAAVRSNACRASARTPSCRRAAAG